jgi:2-amino-4-hydroxy-6-hydroxymethyldihydropteridine diphosphokinase
MQVDAYIAMGSNLGDRRANIQSGLDEMCALESISVIHCSSIIETSPVGPGDQDMYLNAVVKIQTSYSPELLLKALLTIESKYGRDRASEIRWGARTLDLDVLVYGDLILDEPGLTIPHPRLHMRSFVLVPLCEIAPDLKLPKYKKTPRDLLGALESLS